MPRPLTEEIMARRSVRPIFERAQVRKNFAMPESLVKTIEDGCDRYDITENEFIRRLVLAYAIDARRNGPTTQLLDDLQPTERKGVQRLVGTFDRDGGTIIDVPDGTPAEQMIWLMEHVEEFFGKADAAQGAEGKEDVKAKA